MSRSMPWLRRVWWKKRGCRPDALFLLHFPLLLLGNALFIGMGLSGAGAATAILLSIWTASVLLALGFERWVENTLTR